MTLEESSDIDFNSDNYQKPPGMVFYVTVLFFGLMGLIVGFFVKCN